MTRGVSLSGVVFGVASDACQLFFSSCSVPFMRCDSCAHLLKLLPTLRIDIMVMILHLYLAFLVPSSFLPSFTPALEQPKQWYVHGQ